nr:2-aminoethylphosphonate ABC transporter substrate-binding protein [Streptococcus thermophilus]
MKVAVDSPDASSAEELQAVQNLKGQDSQPDVLDIGYSFTNPAIDQGLVEPFKPSTFDEIPDDFKDPEGKWVSAYYGVIEFGVNTKKVKDVPKTFKDLLDPKYKARLLCPATRARAHPPSPACSLRRWPTAAPSTTSSRVSRSSRNCPSPATLSASLTRLPP